MRTTVSMDDHLLEEVKLLAVRQGRSMGSVLEDAVRLLLARRDERPAQGVRLTVFTGRPGLRPGVDLDDRAALYDLLDEDD